LRPIGRARNLELVMSELIFLTVDEAREVLRIGRSKFYVLVAEKKIRVTKLGGKSLVAKAELDRFIAELLPDDISAAA